MKKTAIMISILAIIALGVFFALNNRELLKFSPQPGLGAATNPTQLVQEAEPTQPAVISGDTVIAEGKLVPIRSVNLSFNTSGLVEEVLVSEGDTVQPGQVLARLGNREQLQASITAAELDVMNAQQALDVIYRDAPLKAAEALQALVAAPKGVEDAQRSVNNLKYGKVNENDIEIARANLTFAEGKVKKAEEDYKPYANKDGDSLTRAALLSKLAQARKEYDEALHRLNNMLGDPSVSRITQAEADLALAQVRQAEAERKYEILKNGPDPDEVGLANARLANVKAQLAAAQAALQNLELKAPFAGTVVSVDLNAGQFVAPGASLLMLVDFSSWRVETTNLTELNVILIDSGNPARVTFDALPGVDFAGKVTRIKSVGENKQGDITYTAVIELDQVDPRLRWNMTCSVVIDTK